MGWTRKRPFDNQDAAIRHMLGLLAAEARQLGSPLSDGDLDLLSREHPIPEELENHVKSVITQLFDKEELDSESDGCEDPKSFGNTLLWANEPMYPNIARLTEEVINGRTEQARLHGWRRFADGCLLVISALGVVVLLMVVGYFLSK